MPTDGGMMQGLDSPKEPLGSTSDSAFSPPHPASQDGHFEAAAPVRHLPPRAASARISAALEEERKPARAEEEARPAKRARTTSASSGAGTGKAGVSGRGRRGGAAKDVADAASASADASKASGGSHPTAYPYAYDDMGGSEEEEEDSESDASTKSGKKREPGDRVAKSRERNRLHARKSRLRKKFFVDSLKANLEGLERENQRLRAFILEKTGASADELLKSSGHTVAAGSRGGSGALRGGTSTSPSSSSSGGGAVASASASLLSGPGKAATAVIQAEDYRLVENLATAQQNFCVSDPNLPDNPIVFASQGFYELTGYTPSEVIGRNCRLLQGAGTEPSAVAIIRKGMAEGRDTAVCLTNYKKDGRPFWNSFFVAALRGVDGRVVNYVGVQCEVKPAVAAALVAAQNKSALPPPHTPAEAVGSV